MGVNVEGYTEGSKRSMIVFYLIGIFNLKRILKDNVLESFDNHDGWG